MKEREERKKERKKQRREVCVREREREGERGRERVGLRAEGLGGEEGGGLVKVATREILKSLNPKP